MGLKELVAPFVDYFLFAESRLSVSYQKCGETQRRIYAQKYGELYQETVDAASKQVGLLRVKVDIFDQNDNSLNNKLKHFIDYFEAQGVYESEYYNNYMCPDANGIQRFIDEKKIKCVKISRTFKQMFDL